MMSWNYLILVEGQLKAVKIGSQIRIPREYYKEFMNNHVIQK